MKQEVKHTTIRNGSLFCLNCGGEHRLVMPMPVGDFEPKVQAFNTLHKHCKPTWKEPEADQTKSVQEKAMFWLQNGERGMSSETMWYCLMGQPVTRVNFPHDPDDFSRCYKLLQFVPEWKSKLHKLKGLNSVWSNLIDNWDTLTEMYERNTREQWKNYKQVGMYDLMQKLIDDGREKDGIKVTRIKR